MQVNVFEAKTDLSKLIKLVETRNEEYITIARHGKPVVNIVPFNNSDASKRIGIAEGLLDIPDDFDKYDDEILEMFGDKI